ncbi:MAG TPA: hypothetical protein PKE26_00440 [Kiritimatiellia bacterium]|nr:hypothetical protein [Kiritimatiellia bacterium]HMO97561.1 hypothetical protein [Kiritimatiellia bacterium]HMP95953.1 hypothetical protein [Kiritimatiellia bacterium]
MFRSSLFRSAVFVASMVFAAGCGGSEARSSDETGATPWGAPAELARATLLYHRPDGIYLRGLGDLRPHKLVTNGAYPRWAPDGAWFAFLRGNEVMVHDIKSGKETGLATLNRPRAIAVHPSGREVFVADGKRIVAVDRKTGALRTVVDGTEAYELDVAASGEFLAVTVKSLGWRVRRIDMPSGKHREMGRGCSAGISPDSRFITVNLDGHTELALVDARTGKRHAVVNAPDGLKLDNQKWSNHPDWLAVIAEGPQQDILIQRVGDGRAWRVTDEGDCDRPDLWVP